MSKKLIAIIVSFLVVVAVSVLFYSFLNNLLIELAQDSPFPDQVKTEINAGLNVQLLVQCFSFLFALGCLPFIFSGFSDKMKINKQNFWVAVLILDLAGLIIAYATTPPDMTSTMMIFALWQLPVIVNFACLIMVTRKKAS